MTSSSSTAPFPALPLPSYTFSSSSETASLPSWNRQTKSQSSDFIFKHGRKHHRHKPDKVPYPLDYNKNMLDTTATDILWEDSIGHAITWMDFRDNPPQRILDLGCGTGIWALYAAKEWPNCQVVGLDLVDIQPPLKYTGVGDRVQWVHTNFLSNQLPFEEESFDYVHISSISKGVPESKWGPLYEEIQRILKPSGAIEVIEEDIIFPVLPRWFTSALHQPIPNTEQPPGHDYALLEALFYSVFERRFINIKPTATIGGYFASYFVNTIIAPPRIFTMPSFRLPPRPAADDFKRIMNRSNTFLFSQPPTPGSAYHSEYILSTGSYFDIIPSNNDTDSNASSEPWQTDSFSSRSPSHSQSAEETPWSLTFAGFSSRSKSPDTQKAELREYWTLVHHTDGVKISDEFAHGARSMPMHLWYSLQGVLACREAMWEEFEHHLRTQPDWLASLGWKKLPKEKETDVDLLSEERKLKREKQRIRREFEELFEQYEYDVNLRISLAHSLEAQGWNRPVEEHRSEAELIQLERLYLAYEAESCKPGFDEIEEMPSRVVRFFAGYKGDVEVAQ